MKRPPKWTVTMLAVLSTGSLVTPASAKAPGAAGMEREFVRQDRRDIEAGDPRDGLLSAVYLFVEPQLRLRDRVWRGLGGAKLTVGHRSSALGVLLEGGATLAADGHGGFFGGAFMWGVPEFAVLAGCRNHWLRDRTRLEAYVDVQFAWLTVY